MNTPQEAIARMESNLRIYGNGTGAKILALAKSGAIEDAAHLAAINGVSGIAAALLNGDEDRVMAIQEKVIADRKAKFRK